MWPLVDTYYQLAKKLIEWNEVEVMDLPEDEYPGLFSEVFAFQDPLFIDLLKKSVRSNNQEHYKPAVEFSLNEINQRLNQLNYVIRGWKKKLIIDLVNHLNFLPFWNLKEIHCVPFIKAECRNLITQWIQSSNTNYWRLHY